MNTIVDTAPPHAPQLPRIEPTDILRAAGHMGIGTAAGHALAEQLMAAATLARAKGQNSPTGCAPKPKKSAPHTNAPTNSTATTGHPKPDAPTGDNSKNTAKKSATKPNKPKAPPP